MPTKQPQIIETYSSGTSWYRVYSDGWCEQGGNIPPISYDNYQIDLLKNFKDTNYTVTLQLSSTITKYVDKLIVKSTNWGSSWHLSCDWQACGYTSINTDKTIIKY